MGITTRTTATFCPQAGRSGLQTRRRCSRSSWATTLTTAPLCASAARMLVQYQLALYQLAKAGKWEDVLGTFAMQGPYFARLAARYVKPSSGWTLLHQAAYWGHESAARQLIGHGSSGTVRGIHDGKTPKDVAESKAAYFVRILEDVEVGNWVPMPDATLVAASSRWGGATPQRAAHPMKVMYGGTRVSIERGQQYWEDAYGRVVIGWHGTFDPPCDMDGMSMV